MPTSSKARLYLSSIILKAAALNSSEEPLLLSRLGILLRRVATDFDVRAYGYPTLKDLLVDLPELGELVVGPNGHPQFRIGPSPQLGQEDTGPIEAPAPDSLKLKVRFWQAITSFRKERSRTKFDLDSARVLAPEADSEDLLERFPERFLALPDAGESFQKLLAIQFLKSEAGLDEDEIGSLVEPAEWLMSVSSRLKELGKEVQWRDFRNEGIVRLAVEWAEKHGIELTRIADSRKQPSKVREERASRPPAPPNVSVSIRQGLHQLIDSLSDDELRHISVPAWILFRQR